MLKNTVFFIPIKEQSERVPNKNFRMLGGVPLWKIVVQKLSQLAPVFIDTDSRKIWFESQNISNVCAYMRRPTLKGNKISVNLLIDDFIKTNMLHYYLLLFDPSTTTIVQTHVTSPFLSLKTIEKAVGQFQADPRRAIFSVRKHQNRFWISGKEYGYCCDAPYAINHDPAWLKPTQELKAFYEETSSFYIFNKELFKKHNAKNRLGSESLARKMFEISFPEYIDIDTEEDWKLAEMIVQDRNRQIKQQKFMKRQIEIDNDIKQILKDDSEYQKTIATMLEDNRQLNRWL